jgi:hypothetical protein
MICGPRVRISSEKGRTDTVSGEDDMLARQPRPPVAGELSIQKSDPLLIVLDVWPGTESLILWCSLRNEWLRLQSLVKTGALFL